MNVSSISLTNFIINISLNDFASDFYGKQTYLGVTRLLYGQARVEVDLRPPVDGHLWNRN